MKAIRIHEHGGPEVLRVEDVPDCSPKAGEICIEIRASALNHMDLWVRKGLPGIGELPLILGCDAAGVVSALGEGVSDFSVGEEVFVFPLMNFLRADSYEEEQAKLSRHLSILGEHVDGTHCEKICMPATHVVKKPSNISFEQAGSFALTFVTAWHMLVTKGRIKPGQDVLIMAATSGIGVAAVQIAKHFGAHVIATGSGADRLAKLKELGADEVIDHYNEDLAKRVKDITNKKGVELIFEHVGESVWEACLKALAWGGRLVTCGATSGPHVKMDLRHIFIKQQEILGSTMGSIDELYALTELIAEGKLAPIVDRTFSPEQIQEAHEYLAKNKPFGKVVITW